MSGNDRRALERALDRLEGHGAGAGRHGDIPPDAGVPTVAIGPYARHRWPDRTFSAVVTDEQKEVLEVMTGYDPERQSSYAPRSRSRDDDSASAADRRAWADQVMTKVHEEQKSYDHDRTRDRDHDRD